MIGLRLSMSGNSELANDIPASWILATVSMEAENRSGRCSEAPPPPVPPGSLSALWAPGSFLPKAPGWRCVQPTSLMGVGWGGRGILMVETDRQRIWEIYQIVPKKGQESVCFLEQVNLQPEVTST